MNTTSEHGDRFLEETRGFLDTIKGSYSDVKIADRSDFKVIIMMI